MASEDTSSEAPALSSAKQRVIDRSWTVRDAFLSLAICLALICPLVLLGAKAWGISLPYWASNEAASYLVGSNETKSLRDYLSYEGVASGDLQKCLDEKMSDSVPLKFEALLGYGALQRGLIAISNQLFRWEAYPTFYGTENLSYPDRDVLGAQPFPATEDVRSGIAAFADECASFATEHPDVQVHILIPTQGNHMKTNPAWSLVSAPYGMEDFLDSVQSFTDHLPNVTVIGEPYSTFEEYEYGGYATDPHWNGYGAMRTYNLLANAMGIKPMDEGMSSDDEIAGYVFNGQLARSGLMLLDREVNEPALNTSSIHVMGGGSVSEAMIKHKEEAVYPQTIATAFNFYASWYGADAGCILRNVDVENGKSVLLITDSYGDAFRWMMASNVSEVVDVRDLRGGSMGNESLMERLAMANADQVVFLGSIANYSTFIERHSVYFHG